MLGWGGSLLASMARVHTFSHSISAMRAFMLMISMLPSIAALSLKPKRGWQVVTMRHSRPSYVPGEIADPGYVRIFDTTLRDGEQSPGATLTSYESSVFSKLPYSS